MSREAVVTSILLISEILLLVEQIGPRTTQIDDFGTAISIFLQARTFKAVESVWDSFTTTDDAFILIVTERAFIADASQGSRADVAVTDWAFAVAFIAEATEWDPGCFAAHDEIGMMARHGGEVKLIWVDVETWESWICTVAWYDRRGWLGFWWGEEVIVVECCWEITKAEASGRRDGRGDSKIRRSGNGILSWDEFRTLSRLTNLNASCTRWTRGTSML
jgi:hypothetical protein